MRRLNQPRTPFVLRPKHFRGIAHIVPRIFARGSKWWAYPTTINAQQKNLLPLISTFETMEGIGP